MSFDFASITELVKQAQEMKKKVGEAQEELARKTVTASVGGGMVTVTVNGASEVLKVTIDREVINPDDPEMLTDLIKAAVNEALKKAQDLMAQEMGQITGGLNLPGLFGG